MKRLLFYCLMTLGAAQLIAQAQWPAITQQAKPWTRWWWMGSAVDENNISTLLKQYSESGLGGVEIVPIYGAKGYESRYIKYLSPRWMQMLDHTVSRANALNMGVYISVGTGWPIGGSHVTKADAASKALVQQYNLKANMVLSDLIVVNDPRQKDGAVLSVLMGYNNAGQAIDLTDKVDASGRLNFKPGEDLKLYALFNAKTRQAVKRAAPGGEGFTIDHFSKVATANYFKAFNEAFGGSSHGVKGFFNDSYEVYGANWTPEFLSEFSKRRGYDLKQYINVLFSDTTDDRTARIKSDYRETMANLMLENFSTVYTNWTRQRNALSINQAHGSPGNLLDLYSAFDVPETETFGSSYFAIKGLRRDSADIRNVDPDPNMLKFASSAAHAYGKPLTSCETFTWLSEHFKTSWSQCKPEVDQVFLSGINHVFYHGTTYSPSDAKWPGWLFYASVNFVPDNSLWPHLKGLNEYIARCQSVLQAGAPDNELAIYWPVYDIWHNAKGMDKPLSVHHVDDWLHPTAFYKNLVGLQDDGYSLDFVSDKMLEQAKADGSHFRVSPKGSNYKVLLIPACNKMPVATFKNIVRLAFEGASVIIQQFPQDVPGYKDVEQRKQELKRLMGGLSLSESGKLQVGSIGKGKVIVGDMQEALNYLKVARETIADNGLKFIRRKSADVTYYFIVNNTANDFDKIIALENNAATVLVMDPLNGAVRKVSHQNNAAAAGFRLQLKSGASVIIKLSGRKEEAPAYKYLEPAANGIQLQNNRWTLSFKEGGPHLPASRQMTGIKPWTDFTGDAPTQAFSGTGVYTTSFVLKNKAADYLLQLVQLYESARIIVNGKDAGLIWSLPFEKRIGQYLKPGNNTISIEVCNLMANRIRDMDQKGEVWRNYHEINFVNINYKDFDAGKWKVQPSGLGGTVQLVPLK